MVDEEEARGDNSDLAMLREYRRDLEMKKEELESAREAERELMDEYRTELRDRIREVEEKVIEEKFNSLRKQRDANADYQDIP